MIDFTPIQRGEKSFAGLAADLTKADLYQATAEIIADTQSIVADAIDADVAFEPNDPAAKDTFGKSEEAELAWSLGHVIVHATASSEEAASLALTLARGLPVEGRSRYEVPWRDVTTTAQIQQRLAESLRMRTAMLDAWPDKPDLEITYTPFPQAGPLNAIARFMLGLYHEASHLEQMREIMRQGRELHPRT